MERAIKQKKFKNSANIAISTIAQEYKTKYLSDKNSLDIESKIDRLSNIVSNYNDFWLHKVTKKDTLKTISIKYFDNEKHWKDIYEYNTDRIDKSHIINEGQILRIPIK